MEVRMAKKVSKPIEEVSENNDDSKTAEAIESKKITKEMIAYVRENSKHMTYGQMADELGIQKGQVSTILQSYKRRLRSRIGLENYAKRVYVNQKGEEKSKTDFSKPLTEEAERVEEWIKSNLSRPVKSSNMGQALSDDVDDVLSNL